METKNRKSIFTLFLLLFIVTVIATVTILINGVMHKNAIVEDSNSNDSERVHIIVNKKWKLEGPVTSTSSSMLDYFWSNLKRYKIRIELYQNGTFMYSEYISQEAESYQIDFGNLPKYINGEKCTYTIKEVIPSNVSSYSYEYKENARINTYVSTGNINMRESENEYIFDIENNLSTSVSGTGGPQATRRYFHIYVEWKGDKNNIKYRPQNLNVKVNFESPFYYLNDKEYIHQVASSNCVDKIVRQYYSYQGKPKIIVKQDEIPRYKTEYKIDDTDNNDTVTVTIINTFINKQTFKGDIIWNEDDEKNRPQEVTVWLLREGEKYVSTKISAADNWKYKFDDIPILEDGTLDSGFEEGHEFEYTIEEEIVPGYKVTYDENNIINTLIEQMNIEVVKVWNDNENIAGKRPDSIKLQLKNNGIVLEEAQVSDITNWKHIFKVPKYDEFGNEIYYTIDEDFYSEFYIKEIVGNVITNKFVVPEDKVKIFAQKVWEDDGNKAGKRPDFVILQLKVKDKVISEAEVSEENNWSYEFEAVKYDNLGNEISYYIDEKSDEKNNKFYVKELTDKNIVTNRFEVPDEKVIINAKKIWEDNNNKLGKRPNSVILQIKSEDKVIKEAEVSISNNWSYDFELPKYDELGNEIYYTIDEKETTNDYIKELKGTSVINRLIYQLPNTSDINIFVYVIVFCIAIIGVIVGIIFIRKNRK